MPESRGYLARFAERMLYRAGVAALPRHVESTYGVGVRHSRELDLGVQRLDLVGGGTWIARTFPSSRALEAAEADADLLARLAAAGFPAERVAVDHPVSVHQGQAVLVTDLAPGRPLAANRESFERLGRLLGMLHALPIDGPGIRRPGGAWHHLILDGSTSDEVAAIGDLLNHARHLVPAGQAASYDELVAAVEALDPCDDLPTGLVHADMVPRNAIRAPDGGVAVIDWTGAGRGPRVVPRVPTVGGRQPRPRPGRPVGLHRVGDPHAGRTRPPAHGRLRSPRGLGLLDVRHRPPVAW